MNVKHFHAVTYVELRGKNVAETSNIESVWIIIMFTRVDVRGLSPPLTLICVV
jgi:hypothetical protein